LILHHFYSILSLLIKQKAYEAEAGIHHHFTDIVYTLIYSRLFIPILKNYQIFLNINKKIINHLLQLKHLFVGD